MLRLLGSVAFRLALGYGVLVVSAMMVISAVFYFGTVGVIGRGIDAELFMISQAGLTSHFDTRGIEALRQEIQDLLTDGIDQDTEVYLLLDPEGRVIVGNLSSVGSLTPLESPDRRSGYAVRPPLDEPPPAASLVERRVLVVGRDLHDLHEIEELVLRALVIGGAVALFLAIAGAVLFRRLLERRVADIRRTADEIGSGNLTRRIPIEGAADEFTRLNRDINRMLDRIQHLMDGVRDVSNAIAHDLRTPLGRIRSLLEAALRPTVTGDQLRDTARASIQGIDELIIVFDKLLQIAEAESGAIARASVRWAGRDHHERRRTLRRDRRSGRRDADHGCRQRSETRGDKDLLANATANLLEMRSNMRAVPRSLRFACRRSGTPSRSSSRITVRGSRRRRKRLSGASIGSTEAGASRQRARPSHRRRHRRVAWRTARLEDRRPASGPLVLPRVANASFPRMGNLAETRR